MDVESQTADQIRAGFFRALDIDEHGEDEWHHAVELDVVIMQLPELGPEDWVVLRDRSNRRESKLVMVVDDAVYILRLHEERGIVAARRRCAARLIEHWCTGIQGLSREDPRGTAWEFHWRESLNPTRIDGRVSADGQPDGAEQLARRIAERAGWNGDAGDS